MIILLKKGNLFEENDDPMRKFILTCSLLLLSFCLLSAQDFLSKKKQWNYISRSIATPNVYTTSIRLWEDTLINNQIYTSVYFSMDSTGQKWSPTGVLLRQDGNKVYQYRSEDGTDFLLYDFGLQIGDQIDYNTCQLEVVAIDSVILVDGSYRKKWTLKGFIDEYEWVEGIGALSSFTNHWNAVCMTDFTTNLGCYSEDDEVLLKQNGACFVVNTQQIDLPENFVSVYPNPTNSLLNIEPKFSTEDKLRYKIYNTLGQQVTESFERPGSAFTINISGLKKGIYILEVSKRDGGKILKKIEKI